MAIVTPPGRPEAPESPVEEAEDKLLQSVIHVRVSDAEERAWKAAAARADMTPSAWIRHSLAIAAVHDAPAHVLGMAYALRDEFNGVADAALGIAVKLADRDLGADLEGRIFRIQKNHLEPLIARLRAWRQP